MRLERGANITVAAGDQSTESLASTVKNTLRRTGRLGRSDARLRMEHVASLAALFFSQTPGLDVLLKAVALCWKHMQDAVSPASMCSDLTWSWMHWNEAEMPA